MLSPIHLRLLTLRSPPLSTSSHTFTSDISPSAFPLSSSYFPRARHSAASSFRHASTSSAASKASTRSTNRRSPSTLAKPDRFRPPSHPSGRAAALAAARRRQRNPFADGPPLSEAERMAQQVKRYPNTFPQKGTLARKVLTNRSWHPWFAMVRPNSLIVEQTHAFFPAKQTLTPSPLYLISKEYSHTVEQF